MKCIKKIFLVLFSFLFLFPTSINAISYYDDELFDFDTLASDYVYIYDLTNQRVVYSRQGDEQFYPASLTKMMTLILGIENIDDYDEKVTLDSTIFAGLIEAQASRAGFGVNDSVSYMDLFYGILLPSGAECTRAIAYNVGGSEDAFVEMMNQKAQELNMSGTHFVNDTGLHDENHYSTPSDMAKLLAYCSENELFMKIFTTSKYVSESTATYVNGLSMESTLSRYCNNIYEGACPSLIMGAKSGYTNPAMYCLASMADIDDIRYIVITGHAQWDDSQHNSVTDHVNTYLALENDHYQYQQYALAGDILINSKVENTFNKSIVVSADNDISGYYPSNSTYHVLVNSDLSAPIIQGDTVGYVYIESDGQILYQQPLYASETIQVNDFVVKWHDVLLFIGQYGIYIIGVLVLIIVLLIIYIVTIFVRLAKKKKQRQLRKAQRMMQKQQEKEENKV